LLTQRNRVLVFFLSQALRLTLQVIKGDSGNAEAYAIRGMALFLR
jgi:hypothetical protein